MSTELQLEVMVESLQFTNHMEPLHVLSKAEILEDGTNDVLFVFINIMSKQDIGSHGIMIEILESNLIPWPS